MFSTLLMLRASLALSRRTFSACGGRGAFAPIVPTPPPPTRLTEAAYTGLVRPMLEYASIIYDPYTANLSNEIEKLQRRAVHFVTSDYYSFEPGSITRVHHLSDPGWQSLKTEVSAEKLIH